MATLQITANNNSAAASAPVARPAMSPLRMWTAVIGSTLGAFMAVLNIQIVNASLADIQRPVDIVDIFRSSDAALGVTREAIRIGAKVVWMQLGVRNDEAARLAEDAGLKVVMNRCPKIEYGRLSGELGWAGVNSRMLSSRRPLLGPKGVQHRVLKAAGD